MKNFVDSQAQFVGDTLLEAQPMKAIAKERRDVSSASAAEDESRGRVENALQSINLFLCNTRKQTVLIIAAGEYQRANERLRGLDRQRATDRLKSTQLEETGTDSSADV